MQTFFVEIKCKLGKTYPVASALADREIASEIYSTAGNYDILAKFHLDDGVDIGHFVAAQRFRRLLAERPPDCVEHVGFAAAVRADDGGDAFVNIENCFVGE